MAGRALNCVVVKNVDTVAVEYRHKDCVRDGEKTEDPALYWRKPGRTPWCAIMPPDVVIATTSGGIMAQFSAGFGKKSALEKKSGDL